MQDWETCPIGGGSQAQVGPFQSELHLQEVVSSCPFSLQEQSP